MWKSRHHKRFESREKFESEIFAHIFRLGLQNAAPISGQCGAGNYYLITEKC